MSDALSAGVAGVGLAVPTGSLGLAAAPLIANVTRLTGTTPERALMINRGHRIHRSSHLHFSCNKTPCPLIRLCEGIVTDQLQLQV